MVEDNGRGIPVDMNEAMKMSGVEVVFTQLHAGGKFNNENYSYSGGLHGVGAAVVNALSRWLEVEVKRDGKVYRQRFESYYDKKLKKIVAGVRLQDWRYRRSPRKQGTKIRFLPDDRIFDDITFNIDTISKRLRELAFLNRGIEN